MNINKKLQLNIWISLITFVLMMFIFAWSFRDIYRADQNMLLADEMRKIAFERIFLRDNYILNPSERTGAQWLAKSETLRALLESAPERFTGTEYRAHLQETRENFDATFSSFSQIMEKHKQIKIRAGKTAFGERELSLISQVFLKAYALNDSLDRLYESVEKTATKTRYGGGFLIIFFVTGGILTIVVNSFLLNKLLAKRITTLHEGAKIIGGGNLDYRIDAAGDDELSDLTRVSNRMVENLQQEITRHKQAKEEIEKLNTELEQRVLQRTAWLNSTNKELESFAYSVSHDLRAPLRGIDGWSLALLEDYGERLDDEARRYLHRVRTETQQMGRLIDELLKLSRVTRAELQLMPIDLTDMARRIATLLQEERPHRRIEFIIQPELRANGDSQLINIALSNLFDNAVKFTGTRSHARIEFGEAEVDGEKAFFIRDDGVGFDMAYAPELFVAFQRLHKLSEFPGTGIGLATVQRIIHRHGGRIWANAQVDQGATFYFTLKETI